MATIYVVNNTSSDFKISNLGRDFLFRANSISYFDDTQLSLVNVQNSFGVSNIVHLTNPAQAQIDSSLQAFLGGMTGVSASATTIIDESYSTTGGRTLTERDYLLAKLVLNESTVGLNSVTISGSLTSLLAVLTKFDSCIDTDNDYVNVNMATNLSSAYDTIDVAKKSSGAVVLVHSAITATTVSNEIDCRGYNSIRIEIETSNVSSNDKTWTPTITGSCISGGTFGQVFQNVSGTQTALVLPAIAFGAGNIKQTYVIQGGIPNYLKITETLAGTNGTSAVTVKAVPFNI